MNWYDDRREKMRQQEAQGWSLQQIADYWGIAPHRVNLVIGGHTYISKIGAYVKRGEG